MICPFCGMPIENALHRALKGIQTNPPIVITNVDYVIEVGNKIATVIEEKHTKRHFGKVYQLITLKRVARALDVPLLVVFVDDNLNEVTVYEVPTDRRFPAKRFYNFEKEDPLFIGDFEEFGEFILDNFVYAQAWR